MHFDLRHRALRIAFLGALVAAGPQALAAPTATTHQRPKAEAGAKPAPGRATPPVPAAGGAAHSEKTSVASSAAGGAPASGVGVPPPATGPKVESRRGRGHF